MEKKRKSQSAPPPRQVSVANTKMKATCIGLRVEIDRETNLRVWDQPDIETWESFLGFFSDIFSCFLTFLEQLQRFTSYNSYIMRE